MRRYIKYRSNKGGDNLKIYLVYLVMDDILKNQFPYLVNADTVQYVTENIEISLYAYTRDKDIAMSFINCRNKDIFYVKKKKVHFEDWRKFNNRYYLYELNPVVLEGIDRPLAISRFEEMICTDIEQYKPSIEYIIESRKVNVDTNSINYLHNSEMLDMINKLYGVYKNPFELWVRYFAPTIDIVKMSKYLS